MEPNKFARTSSSPAAYLSELLRKQTFSMFIILLLIWVILSFLSPYFFTVNNLFEITLQSAVFAIIAAGETFVIFSGGIDLSVGSVFAFSSIVGGLAFQFTGNTPLAIIVSILADLCRAGEWRVHYKIKSSAFCGNAGHDGYCLEVCVDFV